MKTTTVATLFAVGSLLALVQGLTCLGGPLVAIPSSIPLGVSSYYLLGYFADGLTRSWIYAAVASLSSAFGVGIANVGGRGARVFGLFLIAPVLAGLSAFLVSVLVQRRSKRCALCNESVAGAIAFQCPRCNLLVCEHRCWVFERVRCKLCEQNQVPLPQHESAWWSTSFGPVSSFGRCEYCKRAAESARLRPCRRCGRHQCEECWDYLNFQCSRCKWIVADLPEPLQILLPVPASGHPLSK